MSDGRPVPGSVWFYAPVHGAPSFFAVAFAISGAVHLWQCIHYKCFRVTGYLPFCSFVFAAGFALREYGAFHPQKVGVYLASVLLVYTSPPVLELANYHILGRTLYYIPYLSPIHPGRVLTTLGSLSAVVEILNALGVSYLAIRTQNNKYYSTGLSLMRASLGLQLGVIAFFYSLAVLFHLRCRKMGVENNKVRAVLVSLYVSMALILGRTIYRAVEHFSIDHLAESDAGQFDPMELSPVIRFEWYFYLFEAALMAVNTVIWNARHPRRYLPRSYKLYLAQDGVTEVSWQGSGWADKRNLVMTVVDPFGLLAMFERGNKGEPFWKDNGFHHLLGQEKRQEAQEGV